MTANSAATSNHFPLATPGASIHDNVSASSPKRRRIGLAARLFLTGQLRRRRQCYGQDCRPSLKPLEEISPWHDRCRFIREGSRIAVSRCSSPCSRRQHGTSTEGAQDETQSSCFAPAAVVRPHGLYDGRPCNGKRIRARRLSSNGSPGRARSVFPDPPTRRTFFRLSNHFISQDNRIFCGHVSSAIVLNALRLGKKEGLPRDRRSIAEDEIVDRRRMLTPHSYAISTR